MLDSTDFKVADLSLAEAGRHQIRLAEREMPGLMALREEFGQGKPLTGARIAGSLHMTVQTAVLIETLVALGAQVRWASCNIFSTQDEAAAAVVVGTGSVDAPAGVPVFAWKGETLEEYWWAADRIFDFDEGANLILDDGGDATMYVLKGAQAEVDGGVPTAGEDDPEEFKVLLAQVRKSLEASPGRFGRMAAGIKGVSEETTTGVNRLYRLAEEGNLPFPAINVNDSVTKSKFDNRYGIRHSLPDGLNRATDVLIGGKIAVVVGYGDVGKGAAEALRGQGARVIVTEIDPICALQATMDGYQVDHLATVAPSADIIITTTGNTRVVGVEVLQSLKPGAIVGNVGHFDDEIDLAGLAKLSGVSKVEIKPQVHEWRVPVPTELGLDRAQTDFLVLSEGRLLNLGNATGHPSFVMSASFTNQVLAQIELWVSPDRYDNDVHRLAKELDEKVARLHLPALGANLSELSKEQAEYIGVDVAGPYKPEHYRY
ncbi:adenosylhomocysteinase [Brevibacterium sp. UCMA 11754]|uniref:adenosylhomocysteinase n=1 Tax=Brevibacterium sp. UCMA 11754 TaxID=2749198 RepID=UPI001F317F7B|nr:adenosylhomocysteinase [Brevibacterium sp. UCMA 11754]MCF2574224.1 adenosylhomocysteinase [Brevibacterium sp. UCMA 11754]